MRKSDVTNSAGGTDATTHRLWWLIGGRLILAMLLLSAGVPWAGEFLGSAHREGGWRWALPVGIVMALSVVYALALRFSLLSEERQAGTQFFFDVILLTWLVWATGDLHSPFVALYLLIISSAGLLIGMRGALFASVGCAVCYTTVMLATVLGGLPHHIENEAHVVSTAQAVGTIGLNNIGFFIVGLLAARLAERQSRSDVQLIKATHALADLRALHERIVESIRSGVMTTDLQGRIYTFNLAAEEITGYTARNLRGQDAAILFGDMQREIEESMRAVAEGQALPRFEVDSLTAEGLSMRLGYSISPLSAEEGETSGLVITFQDLTQIRAMEETSRRQDKLAAVGRIAAGIAHEIRNPLAAMRGSIQVLRSEMTDPAQSELMEIVLRESDRLNRIITDFLTYARPRPPAFAEIDLREPLRETFTLLRHSAEMRDGHVLDIDVPDDPVRVTVDSASIKQVFWNLTRNALHAMPEGGRLRAEMRRATPERLRITFTDTGQGMSPEQVERLFEPFSSSTTGGTGLGLSIVYQIIRDHSGTINVRSREGHGTTITIELPAKLN